MNTGSSGTWVIPWSQTETDGLKAAPLDILAVGASWRWTGGAVRADGSQDVLRLDGAHGVAELRHRAARVVRRLIGVGQGSAARAAFDPDWEEEGRTCEGAACNGFVLTDGYKTYAVALLPGAQLALLVDEMPPRDQDLWVVRLTTSRAKVQTDVPAGGLICFTPDTRIATPAGPRLVQDLGLGDLVLTRDNGPRAILWTGSRRMSRARLYAMPHLRPIRLRAGALGPQRPDPDLLVSPQHRMLLKGRAAQALFNVDEVLVAAEDLVNDQTITVDHRVREVTYIHLLLDQHNVIWANGLETESFHPANADLAAVDPSQRGGLLDLFPALMHDPFAYGDLARRNLSAAEAAILRHDLRA